jgi:hypothetical protein
MTSLRYFDRGPLKISELQSSTKEIVRLVQIQVFTKERELIKAGKSYSLSKVLRESGYLSPLRKLDPILVDGIIRVGGSTDKAPV